MFSKKDGEDFKNHARLFRKTSASFLKKTQMFFRHKPLIFKMYILHLF